MAPSSPEYLNVLASGFGKLLASQVLTRLITFSMNLLVARHLTPEAYGLASVQFHLITTTILLVSREGFRRGCMRARETTGTQGRSVSVVDRILSVSWLVIPVGALVATAVYSFVSWRTAQDDIVYRQAVAWHGVAAFIELCTEPLYIVASAQFKFGLRVLIETIAMVSKCLLTLLLVLSSNQPPALIFAWAQLVFAAITMLGYGLYGITLLQQGEMRWPRRKWDAHDWDVLSISGLFSIQAVEKLLLAEGSKLVLVAFETSYNQGVYGLVSNLGSLVVRTVFQPFEEAAFIAFSRTGLTAQSSAASRAKTAAVLSVLLKGVTFLGLVAVSFGPWYSYTLLRLVYSERWSETEAPFVLGCYTAYILLLAVNGEIAMRLLATVGWLVGELMGWS
eukprot:jgi/Chrzof1/1465/Cz10g08270.t1